MLFDSQFPDACLQVVGNSVNDFYAAFPWDAAESSAPTVIARWSGNQWKFVAKVSGLLFSKMHSDASGSLWYFTGRELVCITTDGHKKVVAKTAEEILADDLVPSLTGSWSVLHSSTQVLTILGKVLKKHELTSKGDLTSLCADNQGRLWAGGSGKSLLSFARNSKEKPLLVGFDGEKKKTFQVPAGAGSINALLVLSTGKIIVSLFKDGLFSADAQLLWAKKSSLTALPEAEVVTGFADDLNGGLYALNANSLLHLKSGQESWEQITVKEGKKRPALRCVRAMSDGLVVGTYKGVLIGPKWHQLPLIPKEWFS